MSCSAIGAASAGGTLTELIAVGAMDIYLIKNPNVTFFRFRYNKHTNFALEAINQPFSSAAFGGEHSVTLNRTGDLIYHMYMTVTLPGIMAGNASHSYPVQSYCDPCDNTVTPPANSTSYFQAPPVAGAAAASPSAKPSGGSWCHWVQAVGQRVVEEAALVIGGQRIDHLYSEYLFMWEELSGKSGKRLLEMVGKVSAAGGVKKLIQDSQSQRKLYVPLPFFFTQSSGNALPLVSLQFHGVQLHVKFAPLSSLIVTSDSTAAPMKAVKSSSGTMIAGPSPIADTDLKAHVDTTYVYLDIEERDRFATGSFEQLVCQTQRHHEPISATTSTIRLNFNHPIIELIWAIRLKCNDNVNNWTDFGNKDGSDIMSHACLKLNNLPRFSNRPAEWFRLVQPYQHHSNIPDYHIYSYSFALHPEEAQPSGSCNFSRIDSVDLTIDVKEGAISTSETATCLLYARNWNIMRYREGLGGVAFSN